ncbi:MAG TPA: molybdenum cofactor guanylyltransferase [Flavobacteriales bacterium]|nr:molybdenum cofactor guanylyltransferase [Flavobacteriales bacterium]
MDRQWTGVVLAGGESSRMGRDKALMEIDGRTMLERGIELLRPHVREVLVIGDPAKYNTTHGVVIPDEKPGLGPLGGLVTALKRARYVRLLVIACDLPQLNDRLMVRLKAPLDDGHDAAVPKHEGLIEPLAAAYHRHAIDAFEECLEQGILKMSDALARVRTTWLDIRPGEDGWPRDIFRNVNSPSDL